ncbi:MAG: cytochrome c biogenesis protein ResB, partial [Planctomycetota bacterium]
QADYDKEGERYTVLQVVKDPGVWLVMVGFACIMLGVIHKFYIRPFLRDPGKEGT